VGVRSLLRVYSGFIRRYYLARKRAARRLNIPDLRGCKVLEGNRGRAPPEGGYYVHGARQPGLEACGFAIWG